MSYRTALNWFLAGTLSVSARQLPTGTILVEPSAGPSGETVAYCGVSSAEQGDDVERGAGRVAGEAGERGITLDATVTGVGSGVTGDRARLRKVLADPRVSGIVVEHRDRLARFGVEHREAALWVNVGAATRRLRTRPYTFSERSYESALTEYGPVPPITRWRRPRRTCW